MSLRERIEKITNNSYYRFTYDPTMLASRTVRKIMRVLKVAYRVLGKEDGTFKNEMELLIAEYEVVRQKSVNKYIHLKKRTDK
jgi:hypothetical protein